MNHDGTRRFVNGLLELWEQDDEAAMEHLRIALSDGNIRGLVEKSLSQYAPTMLKELNAQFETDWTQLRL